MIRWPALHLLICALAIPPRSRRKAQCKGAGGGGQRGSFRGLPAGAAKRRDAAGRPRHGGSARRAGAAEPRAAAAPVCGRASPGTSNDLDSTTAGLLGQPVTAHDEYTSYARSLILRQPLFRPYQWADLRQAHAERDEAQQSLMQVTQILAVRVATAYLQALAAEEQLALALAQKRAYQTQVEAARRRLAGGAGTRTDIDEAQARLDLAFARELEARENLGFTRRQLQQVTGVANGPLVPLEPAGMPLLPPSRRTSTAGSRAPSRAAPSCARCRRSATPQARRSASRSRATCPRSMRSRRRSIHCRTTSPAWAFASTTSRSAWN